jgi:hypothetical protein
MFYLNWTGKALLADAALKLLSHAADRFGAVTSGPTAARDPHLGLPPAVYEALEMYIDLGSRRGFESRLDELGAPADPSFRSALWRAMGGS